MKIAFVTPELEPLVRRTALADIAAALPKALKEIGNDARVFMPVTQLTQLAGVEDIENEGSVTVSDTLGSVTVYLFEHHQLFGSRGPYGGDDGPYEDNWRRYALFSRAVLESLTVVN